MPSICLAFLLVATVVADETHAEIYRWTDENGRVHFGDRPPQNAKAEEISKQAKVVNVDESRKEREKLNKVFAPETQEEKQRREYEAQRQTQELQRQCDEARQRLARLQRPFVMRDADGNTVDISETERETMVEQLRTQIQQRCGTP